VSDTTSLSLTARTSPTSLSGARVAVTVTFLVQALLFASWIAHIPNVKARLGLDDGTLGLALLGAPVGSVLAMLATGWLLPRLGSRRMVQITLAGYAVTGLTVGLAGSLPALFLALALWGAFQGALDVSMNAQGITVERALGRPIMSGLHGAWSIGALVGAGIGTAGVGLGLALDSQLLGVGMVVLLLGGWLSLRLLADPPEDRHTEGSRPLTVLANPIVLTLAIIALACMVCEGAAADWSAVYLRDSLGSSGTFGGLGYVAFSLTMLTVRLGGDALLGRIAARTLLPAFAAIATVGFALALVAANAVAALVGFAALGVGLALIVPTVFSAAGRLPGINAGTAVAAVSAMGWAGFMFGPVAIGQVSKVISLPVALALIPILVGAITVLTRRTTVLDQPTPQVAPVSQPAR
jgi:predicted MFS family arabinose efflux permease